ncbi:hypothetical protein GEO10_14315 [Escherichia coli]|nr:hypothetical protein [Escherichia coli]
MIISDENYFTDKYELTRTHSEVLEAVKVVKPGKTLDLGCGNGRNSLYLAANGYDVDAWDKNAMSIANVERIKSIENLDNLHTRVVDLNNLTFDGEYDFILSTVVLMFLEAKTIPGLIANMQRCTKPGGYNLIVAAMDTADYPCTVGFPFAFKEGELRRYYEGWEKVKYNEDVGELHRTDANGNRIKLRFATMLARKFISPPQSATPSVYDPQQQAMVITSLFPYDPQLCFEHFSIQMASGAISESTPHEKGVIEHVVVIDGQLDLCVDGEWQTLNCGEGVRFAADVTHIYRNGGEQTVHFHSLIHYPRS